MRGKISSIGDTRVSPNGYRYIRTDEGWVLVGRLMMEVILERKLKDNERIKYIDGDRSNLELSNLKVCTVKERSKKARAAKIQARLEEFQSMLEDLEAEDD